MEEKKETVKAEKPSYEQLEREIAGFKGMNNQLIAQLQQMNMSNLFKRLDYLFKVVEFNDVFSSDFVNYCTREIKGHLVLPEEEGKPDNGK